MPKINYTDKTTGGAFTAADANEIKNVVNDNADLPVLETIPDPDATKVGQKFWWNGIEFRYMSTAEITSLGWGVPEGFAAPVDKTLNVSWAIGFRSNFRVNAGFAFVSSDNLTGTFVLNTLSFGRPDLAFGFGYFNCGVSSLENVNLLTSLTDLGTAASLDLRNNQMNTAAIDDFFTQLPTTANTVTIQVAGNPGAATCDPTIATAKGYTVVTA